MPRGVTISRMRGGSPSEHLERCERALVRIAAAVSGMTDGLIMSPNDVALAVELALEVRRGPRREARGTAESYVDQLAQPKEEP